MLAREGELQQQLAGQAHDHEALTRLSGELATTTGERETLELEWLEASALLE